MAAFNERALCQLLGKRYAPPAWAFLPQVRSRTGYRGKITTADAIAISLWPSRGHELHGFEIKVSRSDWQRELAKPDKAETICRYCDRWWVVVDRAEIIQPGEFPPTWGMISADGGKLKVIVEAPKLERQPFGIEMLCSILRNVQEATVPLDEVQPKIAAAREEGLKDGARFATTGSERLRESVKAFAESSGIDLAQDYRWEAGEIGKAAKLIREHGLVGALDMAARLQSQAEDIATRMAKFKAEAGFPQKETGQPVPARRKRA